VKPNGKKETKLLNSYVQNPALLRGFQKIAYWIDKGKGEIWLYDMQTKQNEKILFDASFPIWIYSDKILASNDSQSPGNEDAIRNGFTKSMIVYDVSTKEKHTLFGVDQIKEGWVEFISPLKSGGSNSFFYSSDNQ